MDDFNVNRFCTCVGTKTVRSPYCVDADGLGHHGRPWSWYELMCDCGQMSAAGDDVFDWKFEGDKMTETATVRDGTRGREVDVIHADGSLGNAVCRGNSALSPGCVHFWEIKPDIEVYGTSGMIGIATSNLDVESATRSYHLGLGRDKDGESWGYNYKGEWVHRGVVIGVQRPPVWGLGSIIGVLLDRWKGTLEYYLNREPLGVAFRGIPREAVIYPAISSTASRGGFKLIYARSFRPNLAFECIKRVSLLESDERLTFLKQLSRYPGLSATVDKNYWFLAAQRRRATESRGKTTDEGSVISIVDSSTEDVGEEGEVEISMPGGDFKSKVNRLTRASEAVKDYSSSSSSDSDYGRFRGRSDSPKAKRKRARRTSKTTKKPKGESSESSDFFEPNSPAVAKRLPTAAPALSARRKFRLGSQQN